VPPVGGLVFLVGDELQPGGSVPVGNPFQHREVAHEVVASCAMPVFFAWRRIDGVARPHPDHLAVAGLHQPDAVCDVQGLADRVRVPGAAGAGVKRTRLMIMRDGSSPR
jgi:hypothetical protein